jgi:hypothetical protein
MILFLSGCSDKVGDFYPVYWGQDDRIAINSKYLTPISGGGAIYPYNEALQPEPHDRILNEVIYE